MTSSRLEWRKSSRSTNQGDCVELAGLRPGVAVRDSKNPGGGLLRFDAAAWARFARRAKAGDLDLI